MTPRICKDCRAAEKAYDEWTMRTCCDWVTSPCADCPPEPERPAATIRPVPHPGPRCTTHHRLFRRAQKAKSHESYVKRTYSLGDYDYGKLYEAQGGVCAICGTANGATRKLSVDHDHKCCAGGVSCGYCVRGLLCRPCNDFLGYVRDNWEAFARGIKYLTNPPATAVLGRKRTS